MVDKANVLSCSRLWRNVADKVARAYPDIEVDYMYVDNAVMQVLIGFRDKRASTQGGQKDTCMTCR